MRAAPRHLHEVRLEGIRDVMIEMKNAQLQLQPFEYDLALRSSIEST